MKTVAKRASGGKRGNLRLRFNVPGLVRRPIIGGGCCALPAEFLIDESVGELPEVVSVSMADEQGQVLVYVREYSEAVLGEIQDRIEELGYTVAGVILDRETV